MYRLAFWLGLLTLIITLTACAGSSVTPPCTGDDCSVPCEGATTANPVFNKEANAGYKYESNATLLNCYPPGSTLAADVSLKLLEGETPFNEVLFILDVYDDNKQASVLNSSSGVLDLSSIKQDPEIISEYPVPITALKEGLATRISLKFKPGAPESNYAFVIRTFKPATDGRFDAFNSDLVIGQVAYKFKIER
jgi:hypothetical protein